MKFLIVKPSTITILSSAQIFALGSFFWNIFLANVRDHVSQSYSTNGNIIVFCILINKFFDRNPEDKSHATMTYVKKLQLNQYKIGRLIFRLNI